MPALAELMHTIAVLFVALWAPRRMAMARVRGLNVGELATFMLCLERLRQRGRPLRRPGESLTTVAARIDLMVWIARSPREALRVFARQARGWRRLRLANAAPPCFAPPRLPAPALAPAFALRPAAPET